MCICCFSRQARECKHVICTRVNFMLISVFHLPVPAVSFWCSKAHLFSWPLAIWLHIMEVISMYNKLWIWSHIHSIHPLEILVFLFEFISIFCFKNALNCTRPSLSCAPLFVNILEVNFSFFLLGSNIRPQCLCGLIILIKKGLDTVVQIEEVLTFNLTNYKWHIIWMF